MVSLAFQESFGDVSPTQDLAGLLPQKMHILSLHSSKAKIQWGWMENQEEARRRPSLERRQVHKAVLLPLSHKGLSKISNQEEVKLPFSKEKQFQCGISSSAGAAGLCRTTSCAHPGSSHCERCRAQLLGQYRASNVTPRSRQRHHTVNKY